MQAVLRNKCFQPCEPSCHIPSSSPLQGYSPPRRFLTSLFSISTWSQASPCLSVKHLFPWPSPDHPIKNRSFFFSSKAQTFAFQRGLQFSFKSYALNFLPISKIKAQFTHSKIIFYCTVLQVLKNASSWAATSVTTKNAGVTHQIPPALLR